MAANVNKTKILKYVDGKDPAKGGFLNVVELMHDVVKQMVDGGGFIVKHCSTTDTILNTVPWGTLDNSGTWSPPNSPPAVGSPPSGKHTVPAQYKNPTAVQNSATTINAVSGSPRATITLEAGGPGVITGGGSTPPSQATWVDYLNPKTSPWSVPNFTATFPGRIVPNPADNGATGLLTVLPEVVGKLTVGMTLSGTGVASGTAITAIDSALGGADGTYIVNIGQTVPLNTLAITGTGGVSFNGAIAGYILTARTPVTGTIINTLVITGASITSNTQVVSQLSAVGSTPVLTTTATATLGVSTITVLSATGITAGQVVEAQGIPVGTFVKANYVSGTSIDLVNSAGTAVVTTAALTTTAIKFYTPGGAGTYLVDKQQTVPAATGSVSITGTSTAVHTLINETWRVRFEIINTECVAAYVGTPLQLPGYSDVAAKTPEPWGIPGSIAKIVDPRGVVVDNVGAVGARQWVPSCWSVRGVAIGSGTTATANKILSIDVDGNCVLQTAATFTQGAGITLTSASPLIISGGGFVYGQTYYVVAAVSPASKNIQITDSYANAIAGIKTTFPSPGTVTNGNIAVDTSPTTGSGYAAGDVVYIKDPILSTTKGYTGTVFIRIDNVDSNGGVIAMSVLDGGALVPKEILTGAEQTRAPAIPTLETIAVTGSYYNIITGIKYGGGGPAGGTGLAVKLDLAYNVDNNGPGSGGHVDESDSYQGFFNRGLRVGAFGASYPLRYYLSISNNGFFLGIYESDWATSIGGNGTIAKFTAATDGTKLYAQNVLGTITPDMLLTGDARILGGTRILEYIDPTETPAAGDPTAGNGDAGVYNISTNPIALGGLSNKIGSWNKDAGLIFGDAPTGKKIRNPPVTLTAFSGDSRFNWMAVQRPVDRTTGVILDNYESPTSKHPVFCLNSVAGRTCHFTVREKDISHPQEGPPDHTANAFYADFIQYPSPSDYDNYTYRIPSGMNSEDSHLLFNPQNQITLTEDRTYLVTFPNNLSTARFRYTEEIDMIGYTSSDVLMAGHEINFKTYNESQSRVYVAMPPSGRYNTGVRFCVLKQTNNT